jgi:hypothetical protein
MRSREMALQQRQSQREKEVPNETDLGGSAKPSRAERGATSLGFSVSNGGEVGNQPEGTAQ